VLEQFRDYWNPNRSESLPGGLRCRSITNPAATSAPTATMIAISVIDSPSPLPSRSSSSDSETRTSKEIG